MTKEMSDPNMLFDTLIKEAGLKSDAALAKSIDVQAPTISNMRARRIQLGPAMIIKIMENHHMPLARLKRLLKGEE